MQTGILHLHNIMRWVVILFILITLVKSASGMSGNKVFSAGDKRNALFMMICVDIQLVLGLYLYFFGAWGLKNMQNLGMGNAMKDGVSRFWGVEHIAGMLIGLVLIHIGYATTKKALPDATKYKKLFWFTLIAALVMLASVPWPFREGVGRPLFPGM